MALMRTRGYPRAIRGFPTRPTYRPAYPEFQQNDPYEDDGEEDYDSGYPHQYGADDEVEDEDTYEGDGDEHTDEHEVEDEHVEDDENDFVSLISHLQKFTWFLEIPFPNNILLSVHE
jgi:hypothetical protein